jgi:hypothetical protein
MRAKLREIKGRLQAMRHDGSRGVGSPTTPCP